MSGEISTIVESAKDAIENLRNNDGSMKRSRVQYSRAPLADAPMPPTGKSESAERAISKTGVWGLSVPQRYGGSGCGYIELMQAITRLASVNPTVSGLLSVHSTIGAVSAHHYIRLR